MTSIDKIIQEVMARHGIILDRDDPILMIYTINRQVMEASMGIQHNLLEEYLTAMKTLSTQLQDQSANRLDATIRESTVAAKLALRQEAQRLFQEFKLEGEAANHKLMTDFLHWRRYAGLSAIISMLSLVAAATVLWVS
ncbi:transcriptional activator TraM [Nitrosospira sp. Nsp5]|uniref:Transcriptional activator TraM n=1 Tax=Nitrosospira multiformis TaxID=1231 RepID=A0ABY0TMW6_9PROT|nr:MULTISPECIES: hypothetical protein [Nitrosospira]PTR05624.1 transcriptional activator TraM [Nitrosospira sp. Nsp5]SDR11357.1 Transcriptional activator TraM [Nitrosospira multiformis]